MSLRSASLSIIFATVLFAGCTDEAEVLTAEEQGTTISEVADNPSRYSGKHVSISGEVKEVFDERAFKIEGGDRDLIILTRMPVSGVSGEQREPVLRENDMVQVRGTVHQLRVMEIEHELGRDLGPEIEAALEESRPILIADSVLVTPDNPERGSGIVSSEDRATTPNK